MAKKKPKPAPAEVYTVTVGMRVLWFDPDSEVTDPQRKGQLATVVQADQEGDVISLRKDDGGEAEVTIEEIRPPQGDEDGIRARCDSGYYAVHDWPDRPKKPANPGHKATAEQHRAYADELQKYEDLYKGYHQAQVNARSAKSEKENLFKQDLLAYLDVPLDHPKADTLFSIAWEQSHANGYMDVVHYAEEFVKLIRDEPKSKEPRKYAVVAWTAKDIKEKKPKWSLARCEDWLHDNARQIQDDMVTRGWDSIDTLLSMS